MRKLQASENVVYRPLQAPKIFLTFYFSGKVTTLVTSDYDKLNLIITSLLVHCGVQYYPFHDVINKFRVKYDLRKFYFTSRIVNVWNNLSSFVVYADSVNCFKNRLDKFWSNRDIIYDYQAEIHGTGNRSEVVL